MSISVIIWTNCMCSSSSSLESGSGESLPTNFVANLRFAMIKVCKVTFFYSTMLQLKIGMQEIEDQKVIKAKENVISADLSYCAQSELCYRIYEPETPLH